MSETGNSSSPNLQNPINQLDQHLQKWTSTSFGRRQFLMSASLLLAACATADKTQRLREGDNSGQDVALTPEEEKRMTLEVLPQMQKDYPKHGDPELQNYVSALGQKIVAASNLEGHPYNYTFTVVDKNMVNAFALPAGTVFVTVPLIAMAESEAELAGVIGHEVGHIKARHSAERMQKAKAEQSSTWKYAVGGGLLGGVIGFGLGKLACKQEDRECVEKAAQLGILAGAGGALLIQKYSFMANSREDEMEADRIGFRTAVQAGYNKDHVGNFYSKLLKMEENSKGQNPQILQGFADAMSTHPPSKERVHQMQEMAQTLPVQSNATVNTAQFDQIRNRARSAQIKPS